MIDNRTGFAGNHPPCLTGDDRTPCAPAIEASAISAHFYADGAWFPVLQDVCIFAAANELVAVIGPSGCGKSTLLSILAGLQQPSAGSVLVAGMEGKRLLGATGYMPQKDLLLPWKTVLDNTTIGLEILGVSRKHARAEAIKWFSQFGLDGFERRYPSTLSGGMRQRAALLRTFLSMRDVLLLDEPFGALDALTRIEMQRWLLEVRRTFRKTILLITHDVDEALYLADRVYVMSRRPGSVRADIAVSIVRGAEYVDVVTSREFTELKHSVLAALADGSEMRR